MHIFHKSKMIMSALCAALAISALTASAYAAEGTPIGNFSASGTSSEEENSIAASESLTRRITLSGGVSYDPDTELFYYTVEDRSFGINVPNGAIVTEQVSIQADSTLTCRLYKNGTELDKADISCITEPGMYILEATTDGSSQPVSVRFTIVSYLTNAVKEYRMPADFYVVSATLNGEETSSSPSCVDMSDDGTYLIEYRAPAADKNMQLYVTVDHTPPTAVLTGLTDGKANGSVSIDKVEDEARLYLMRNGKQIEYSGIITKTGAYILTVQDEAGNETAYDFVVVTQTGRSTAALIVSAAVLILSAAGYIIYYKKYVRVG